MIEQVRAFSLMSNPTLPTQMQLHFYFLFLFVYDFVVNPPVYMCRPWHCLLYLALEISPFDSAYLKLANLRENRFVP